MFLKISSVLVLLVVCFGSPAKPSKNQISINPVKITKDVGEAAPILCIWENEPLGDCEFKIPQEGNMRKKIRPLSENLYFGRGLEKGECGINLTVAENHHGEITCELTNREGNYLNNTMFLEVAKMPKEPVLILEPDTYYLEGSNVTATCVVAEGRPPAKITWMFNGNENFDNMIKQQHDRTEELVGSTTTVTERASWSVTADDDQKVVTCTASHHSWRNQDKTASKTITVHYKPRVLDENNVTQKDILYPNLLLGEDAHVDVRVTSNPAPTSVEVTIDNTTVTQDADEKYQLSQPKQENGYYQYSLVIKNLTSEDLVKICTFNVTNPLGSSMATLTFSSRPGDPDSIPTEKPKERAMATNTVTGIIIAVCVIIIILIGIIMFAKFNKKWCFASTPPVHTGQLVASE